MNIKKLNDIIQTRFTREEIKMELTIVIIYVLILIIFGLVAFSIFQLKLAGIKVKDFWSFIQANQMLDKLYVFSKRYQRMSPQEQIVF